MKRELNILKCEECGAQIDIVQDIPKNVINDIVIECCGKKMKLQVPNSVEAAVEKHLPTYEKVEDEIFVKVNHVMEKEHYIEWIAMVTDTRKEFVNLYPEQNAQVRFKYVPNSIIYAYCNKHGLWKTEIK